MSDKYEECPLAAAGFEVVQFSELPTMVIDSDGCCICTKDRECLNVDKRDGKRCTKQELIALNSDAIRRRAWQSGGDYSARTD